MDNKEMAWSDYEENKKGRKKERKKERKKRVSEKASRWLQLGEGRWLTLGVGQVALMSYQALERKGKRWKYGCSVRYLRKKLFDLLFVDGKATNDEIRTVAKLKLKRGTILGFMVD
jgi:hypothetical protein